MKDFKQTWWDNEIKDQFEAFKSWVGPSSEASKVFLRDYIKREEYKSVLDVGCGNATEFEAYQKEMPKVKYTGLDSSLFLNKHNTSRGVPMILADADNTRLPDNAVEVAFSRHVWEHQPDFRPFLKELVRIGSKLAVHVFFISPTDHPEIINYDKKQNLYHNQYNKLDIIEYMNEQSEIKNTLWVPVNKTETVLFMFL